MALHTGRRLVLFSGAGELPVKAAREALDQGWELFVYTIDRGNLAPFKALIPTQRVRFIQPGLWNKIFRFLVEDGITDAIFAGKINKWIMLQSPLLDSRAIQFWRAQKDFNDDALMWAIIRELEQVGVTILPQRDFLKPLFIPAGTYTQRPPTAEESRDIALGLNLAKEMGRLDVGQTVVVKNGMVLAVEAIEGTDQAILRTRKWSGRNGGVVVKVEKPGQDTRFDIPTVGPRTLTSMKKAGLSVLAVEADKTLVLEQEKMVHLANRWKMTVVAVCV